MALFNKRLNLNAGGLYNYFTGRPTTPWGRRSSNETNAIVSQLLNQVDPSQRQALQTAIQTGSFEGLNPKDAALANIAFNESKRAEDMNLQSGQNALQLLAADLGGDINPELAAQLKVDPNSGRARVDRLQSDIMRNVGLQRSGFQQSQLRSAQQQAARTGTPLSEQDKTAIANRGATLYGRQLGSQLGDLRRETEGRRSAASSQIANILSNRVYEPSGALQNLAAVAQMRPRGGTIGRRGIGRRTGVNRFGVGLRF